jgi:hypothetical protein
MDGSSFQPLRPIRAAEIEIEDGVPIPAKGPLTRNRYPLKDMQVGQSFFVPANGCHPNRVALLVSRAAWTFKAKTGAQFTVRNLGNGARCWRIG